MIHPTYTKLTLLLRHKFINEFVLFANQALHLARLISDLPFGAYTFSLLYNQLRCDLSARVAI